MITDYIDEWGLIDKIVGRDGGDVCHKESRYWLALAMMSKSHQDAWLKAFNRSTIDAKKNLAMFQPAPGILLRHPNPDIDAGDWDRFSRDMIKPYVIACGFWDQKQLKRFIKGHAKRAFLFAGNTRENGANKWNHGKPKPGGGTYDYSPRWPDITGPKVWNCMLRGLNKWYLWPLIFIFDIELFIGAINWRYFKKSNLAQNQAAEQMQATHRLPTPFSWLANKIMPIEKLIILMADHLDDHHPTDDTRFLADMFSDAWRNIRQ